ncbi:fatty acid desaturase [Colletotrichum cereale]|nr:fatty acid desaturase [Colletotrichum cereale]
MSGLTVSPDLTVQDTIVLQNLIDDIKRYDDKHLAPADRDEGYVSQESLDEKSNRDDEPCRGVSSQRDARDIRKLKGLNDAAGHDFEPTVLSSVDLRDLPAKIPAVLHRRVVLPYVAWARTVVRHETDVVMLTHLGLYLATSVPSAVLLFRSFGYLHAVLHTALQFHYMGTYTLMMHQHIHMNGILSKHHPLLRALDACFPYLTDPLMGHTWNTYYYHHVKHHHVEGNGPSDLSSTIRYQRDDPLHFLHYVARFFFLVWFDLPRYFFRKRQLRNAAKTAFWELGNYAVLYALYRLNPRATAFVLLAPLLLLRLGLMVGNWGQHAFVDADEPDSDFRSSITLIDVPSNRYCYNDGYHTSHHLNPRRHWRDHPTSFLQQKKTYIREKALVFHDIDYLMVTVRLLRKDYLHLAARLVPVGDQIAMTLEERAAMLRRHTRRFTEDEIREKFRGHGKTN